MTAQRVLALDIDGARCTIFATTPSITLKRLGERVRRGAVRAGPARIQAVVLVEARRPMPQARPYVAHGHTEREAPARLPREKSRQTEHLQICGDRVDHGGQVTTDPINENGRAARIDSSARPSAVISGTKGKYQ